MKISNRVWVVIPAYNEEKNIGSLLRKTKQYAQRILVVDDGSKDDTSQIARKAGVSVIQLRKNSGKGVALRKGCDYAVKHGAKAIITMDADGQHDPADIPKLVKELKYADVVLGVRKQSSSPFAFRFGNWILNTAFFLLFGKRFKDTQSGFRAYTANTYKKIRWKSSRYAVETEVLVRLLRAGLRTKEVLIHYPKPIKERGTTPFDGIKIAFAMLKWRFEQ